MNGLVLMPNRLHSTWRDISYSSGERAQGFEHLHVKSGRFLVFPPFNSCSDTG